MDMSESHEFARMKEELRIRNSALRLLLWVYCAVAFGACGGYTMYASMSPSSIAVALGLLTAAVFCVFLGICEIIDLIPEEDTWLRTKD